MKSILPQITLIDDQNRGGERLTISCSHFGAANIFARRVSASVAPFFTIQSASSFIDGNTEEDLTHPAIICTKCPLHITFLALLCQYRRTRDGWVGLKLAPPLQITSSLTKSKLCIDLSLL